MFIDYFEAYVIIFDLIRWMGSVHPSIWIHQNMRAIIVSVDVKENLNTHTLAVLLQQLHSSYDKCCVHQMQCVLLSYTLNPHLSPQFKLLWMTLYIKDISTWKLQVILTF